MRQATPVHVRGLLEAWDAVQQARRDHPGRAFQFVETWFLANPGFPLCVKSRRFYIQQHMGPDDLQRMCASLWCDVMDPTVLLDLHVVRPTPLSLRSSTVHLIIQQGIAAPDAGLATLRVLSTHDETPSYSCWSYLYGLAAFSPCPISTPVQ